jgi:hypothetical protein
MKRILITAGISLVVGLVLGVMLGRRLPPTREQVSNYLTGLSMGEFTEFAKRMNSQFGFQAFPQNFLPAVPTIPSEPGR